MLEWIDRAIGRVAADARLWTDLEAICAFGGRVCGTDSERRAVDWLRAWLAGQAGAAVRDHVFRYGGWRATACRLDRLDPGGPIALVANPLIRSAGTGPAGVEAEVLDLGRGTPDVFDALARELRGRFALVRHEYMFADGHLHRRRKYQWAIERGAAGFLIASSYPGIGPVAGSTGRDEGPGIPGVGIAAETAALLANARARLTMTTEEAPAEAVNLIAEWPGAAAEWIVLSAHIDGHGLAQSALDNGTGLAAVLATARALVPERARFRRGLRVCLFNAEEWALTGSRIYADGLGPAERDAIVLNVNLDSVAGHERLAALTSGFAGIEPFLAETARGIGLDLRLHRPLMSNSDHANFAAVGVPAFRLVAGFDDPASRLRHVLTPADTLDKAAPGELKLAALLTTAVVARLLAGEGDGRAFRV
ncbi:MAG: M28 family peptidase [Alphaproteobacteria bacterium]|nr:M28 family peptidase [Alphaproteobacteria bacterium]